MHPYTLYYQKSENGFIIRSSYITSWICPCLRFLKGRNLVSLNSGSFTYSLITFYLLTLIFGSYSQSMRQHFRCNRSYGIICYFVLLKAIKIPLFLLFHIKFPGSFIVNSSNLKRTFSLDQQSVT